MVTEILGHSTQMHPRGNWLRRNYPSLGGLILDAKLSVGKTNDPGGTDQQKLKVFKKRWLLTLNFMSPKLHDPKGDEEEDAGLQKPKHRNMLVPGDDAHTHEREHRHPQSNQSR